MQHEILTFSPGSPLILILKLNYHWLLSVFRQQIIYLMLRQIQEVQGIIGGDHNYIQIQGYQACYYFFSLNRCDRTRDAEDYCLEFRLFEGLKFRVNNKFMVFLFFHLL